MSCCKAITPNGPCKVQAMNESRYCEAHEMQQAKSLKTYKRLTREYLAFENKATSPTAEQIETAELQTLQDWASEGRRRWILADRCQSARIWHHQMFCEGGDAGHLQFVDYLKGEKARVESLSKLLDAAAYKHIIAQQEAEWLQSERREPSACIDVEDKCAKPDCKKPSQSHNKSKNIKKKKKGSAAHPRSPPPPQVQTNVEEDPEQDDSDELKTHLNTFLEHHMYLPASPAFQNQRRLIIEQVFRHLIAFEPVLLVRAQAFTSVQDLLASDLSIKELRLLSDMLRYAPSGKIDLELIHQCILAALHGIPAGQSSVKLLGGGVSRKPLPHVLGPDGWCHLYHFNGCAGCGKRAATSFDEVSWVMQEMRPEGALARWSGPSPTTPTGLQLQEHGLAVIAACNPTTHLERVKNATGARKPVFIEREHRCFVFLRTTPGPHADVFVKNLRNIRNKCMVITQNGRSDIYPGSEGMTSSDLWTTRVRSGSKTERASQKWSIEASLVLKSTFEWLSTNYAEGRHRDPFEDVLNILILNNKEEYKNCEAFLNCIAEQLPPKPAGDQLALQRASQELRTASGGDQSVVLSRALFT